MVAERCRVASLPGVRKSDSVLFVRSTPQLQNVTAVKQQMVRTMQDNGRELVNMRRKDHKRRKETLMTPRVSGPFTNGIEKFPRWVPRVENFSVGVLGEALRVCTREEPAV